MFARAIIEDCLAPAYVSAGFLLNPESELAAAILLDTFTQLKDDSSEIFGKLIWDSSFKPAEVKAQYDVLVKMILEAGSYTEAISELQEHKWKFFLHEFVRKLCVAAFKKFEKDGDAPLKQVVVLLKEADKHKALSGDMVRAFL